LKSFSSLYCLLNFLVLSSQSGLGTGAPVIESPYGETISPEDAPESISKAVASLPPEQMFELMKQMKVGGGTSLWINQITSNFQGFH